MGSVVEKQRDSKVERSTGSARQWRVILLDDDQHTYAYVIEMLCKLFNFDEQHAFAAACEVDRHGRVVVETTYLERAEFKRDQIHAYGADWRLERSAGSMAAQLEPA